ncbi:Phytoene synthase [Candidatus Burkholderia pumila]|uniref:Phytoene synthase n=1 Tax=Candidatus Burkholderia pumila TaxID=1090375 RepID=A0ABR5HNN6_9BURK|nr:Phytoene synthase [Candidatus Burkholderia pumila]
MYSRCHYGSATAESVLAVSNIIADESTTDAAKASSGSSFYLAMRILPAAPRDAMYQIYAFCRAVDDIADEGSLPRRERAIALDCWREDIDACYRGEPKKSLEALTRHIQTFHLSRDDFHAVIDGIAMDAAGDIVAPDEATLDLYCDRVASAVGRLSVRIFGMQENAGRRLAHHLGRALQLTNILRDIDEDAAIGRVYLPHELLAREDISTTAAASIVGDARLPRVCAVLAERAKGHYAQSNAIMAASPRHEVRTPRIMSAAYRAVFDANLKRGFDLPREPVRTPRARLLWIVARNVF